MDADQDAVQSLVSSLAALNADRLIDEKPSDLAGSASPVLPKKSMSRLRAAR